jgi:hypothetical protein
MCIYVCIMYVRMYVYTYVCIYVCYIDVKVYLINASSRVTFDSL